LLHWPDPATPLEETMGAMAELVQAGKVRAVGCSNFSVQQMREANHYFPLQAHQLPYSMLNRSAESELLSTCQVDGIGVIVYWALCRGLLTGKHTQDATFGPDDWRHFDPLFQGEVFRHNLGIVESLRPIAEEEGITLGQLAIAWVVHPPGVTTTIVGAKSPEQVEQNAAAGDVLLSPSVLAKIEKVLESGADS